MTLVDIGRLAVGALLTGVLAWASFTDIKERKIRNVAVLCVLGLFVPWAFMVGSLHEVLLALAAGAVALIVGFAVFSAGWMGAGDAKLFAATALFAGWRHLFDFTVLITLAGGMIALFSLISRPREAIALVASGGKSDAGRGIPYGVAIAVGSAVLLWSGLLHMGSPLAAAASH